MSIGVGVLRSLSHDQFCNIFHLYQVIRWSFAPSTLEKNVNPSQINRTCLLVRTEHSEVYEPQIVRLIHKVVFSFDCQIDQITLSGDAMNQQKFVQLRLMSSSSRYDRYYRSGSFAGCSSTRPRPCRVCSGFTSANKVYINIGGQILPVPRHF